MTTSASEALEKVKTLSEARAEILEKVKELPELHQTAFLVSQCQRAAEIYSVVAELEDWQDKRLATDVLAALWNYLIDRDQHLVAQLTDRFERITEEESEYKFVESHFSEFSLTCLAATTTFVLDKTGADAAMFSIFDVLKSEYAHRKYGYFDFGDDPKGYAVDSEIMKDEIVRNELETQARQFDLLNTSTLPFSELVDTLRRDSIAHKLQVRFVQ